MNNWLIIADGEHPSTKILKKLVQDKKIMALDGALDYLLKKQITPDILLGDFDSVSLANLAIMNGNKETAVIRACDQSKTDLEKAIIYLDSIGAESIAICGAQGGRTDHTLYNIRLLKKFYNSARPLTIINNIERIIYGHDEKLTINGRIGDRIAIMSAPKAVISTQGLQYDVNDFIIEFGENESVSNALACEQAQIEISGSALVIMSSYLYYENLHCL